MVYENEKLLHGDITGRIIGAAMEVHKELGPGFFESVYEESLAYEFELQNIYFEKQKTIDVYYKTKAVKQFVCDFLVDNKIVVELKAIKAMGEIEKLQVVNYWKAGSFEVGLLINFGCKSLEYKRLINTKNNLCNSRNP